MNKTKLRQMTLCALLCAVMCVIAPLSVPLSGEIPISLATAVVYLCAASFGGKLGTLSTLLYVLIGTVGVPVFSGFRGGLSVVAGPGGGFILGYIPCALICGALVSLRPKNPVLYPLGMILGTAVLYAVGTAWFVAVSGVSVKAGIASCVVPFLFGDSLKIISASVVSYGIRKRGLLTGYTGGTD